MKTLLLRLLVLTAAVGVGAAALPAPGAAAAAKRVLTIEGSEQGEARIELVRPTIVKSDIAVRSDQVTIAGRGRVVGAVLERVGPGPEAMLLAANYNLCGQRACEPLQASEFIRGAPSAMSDRGIDTTTLPAGRYRVVLIADGAPVRVRLELSGLAASTTLRPTKDAGVAYRRIADITATPTPATVTFSGGRTYPAARGAVVLFQELFRTSPGAAGVSGTCIIFGEAPPADAYAPTCPNGDLGDDRQELVTQTAAPPPSNVITAGFGVAPIPRAQQTSIGHYFVSAVPVTNSNVTQIEVPLNRRRASADTGGMDGSGGDKSGDLVEARNGKDARPAAAGEQRRQREDGVIGGVQPQLPATGGGAPLPAVTATAAALYFALGLMKRRAGSSPASS